ncbi:carnitine dehydratase [Streptomyces mashuensis]|uniref:Carnitine dehydratase n=1 Tax=Streptomyces mashuensis TaxID=33904 RepID=A0A919AZ86_9ACTN|nr:CoA transferase [Streptomyces mashuensis]GHF32762.1 carnitine dehydratase [Streptomyces mashuensis]
MKEDFFDPIGELDRVLKLVGLSRDPAVSELRITGQDPILPSTLRMGSAIGISLLSAAVGAARIWHERTGRDQRLEVDLAQALHRITPYLGGGTRLNGYGANMGSVLGGDGTVAPAVWDFYRAGDGRWVIPIACYPRTRDALTALLGTAHTREHFAAAIGRWNAWELEDAAAEQGIPMAVVRTREEFLAHPQGRAVLAEPVVSVERIGDAPPRPLPAAGPQPLSGLRVLQFTHIFAGTAAGRALAEHGADALHVCEPNAFDHDLCWNECGIGLRSARLDLRDRDGGRAVFDELLRTADVFVHNHRASKMARLGLGPEDCAELAPGIIHLSVSAYGTTGPWRDRGGFDQQAQALTGINWNEREGDEPRMPPGRMLNDYLAANFAAAGVMAAALRRAREGGSYRVRVSLAGVANWAWELGTFDRSTLGSPRPEPVLPEPEWLVHDTPLGEFRHVAPPVRLSGTPSGWTDTVLVPRGSSKPRWRDRPPVAA